MSSNVSENHSGVLNNFVQVKSQVYSSVVSVSLFGVLKFLEASKQFESATTILESVTSDPENYKTTVVELERIIKLLALRNIGFLQSVSKQLEVITGDVEGYTRKLYEDGVNQQENLGVLTFYKNILYKSAISSLLKLSLLNKNLELLSSDLELITHKIADPSFQTNETLHTKNILKDINAYLQQLKYASFLQAIRKLLRSSKEFDKAVVFLEKHTIVQDNSRKLEELIAAIKADLNATYKKISFLLLSTTNEGVLKLLAASRYGENVTQQLDRRFVFEPSFTGDANAVLYNATLASLYDLVSRLYNISKQVESVTTALDKKTEYTQNESLNTSFVYHRQKFVEELIPNQKALAFEFVSNKSQITTRFLRNIICLSGLTAVKVLLPISKNLENVSAEIELFTREIFYDKTESNQNSQLLHLLLDEKAAIKALLLSQKLWFILQAKTASKHLEKITTATEASIAIICQPDFEKTVLKEIKNSTYKAIISTGLALVSFFHTSLRLLEHVTAGLEKNLQRRKTIRHKKRRRDKNSNNADEDSVGRSYKMMNASKELEKLLNELEAFVIESTETRTLKKSSTWREEAIDSLTATQEISKSALRVVLLKFGLANAFILHKSSKLLEIATGNLEKLAKTDIAEYIFQRFQENKSTIYGKAVLLSSWNVKLLANVSKLIQYVTADWELFTYEICYPSVHRKEVSFCSKALNKSVNEIHRTQALLKQGGKNVASFTRNVLQNFPILLKHAIIEVISILNATHEIAFVKIPGILYPKLVYVSLINVQLLSVISKNLDDVIRDFEHKLVVSHQPISVYDYGKNTLDVLSKWYSNETAALLQILEKARILNPWNVVTVLIDVSGYNYGRNKLKSLSIWCTNEIAELVELLERLRKLEPWNITILNEVNRIHMEFAKKLQYRLISPNLTIEFQLEAGSSKSRNTNKTEQDPLDEDSFVKIPTKAQKAKEVKRVATEIYFSKSTNDSIAETCKEELEKPSSLDFKDSHFDTKRNVGLKVNTKKGKRKKSLGGSFEKIDKAEIVETLSTDSPLDKLGFSFFPIKTKPEKNELSTKKDSQTQISNEKSEKESKNSTSVEKKSPPTKSKDKTEKDSKSSLNVEKKSPSLKPKKAPKLQEKDNSFEQKIKIDDLPPSSIILHYQKKNTTPATTNVDVKDFDQQKTNNKNKVAVANKSSNDGTTITEKSVESHIGNSQLNEPIAEKNNKKVKTNLNTSKQQAISNNNIELEKPQTAVSSEIPVEVLYIASDLGNSNQEKVEIIATHNDFEGGSKPSEESLTSQVVSNSAPEVEIADESIAVSICASLDSSITATEASNFTDSVDILKTELSALDYKEYIQNNIEEAVEDTEPEISTFEIVADVETKLSKETFNTEGDILTESNFEETEDLINSKVTDIDTFFEEVITNNCLSAALNLSEKNKISLSTDKSSEQTTNNSSIINNENQPQNQIVTVVGDTENSTNEKTAAKMTDTNTEIRVLTLNANEHQDTVLYRIEQNWIIQFRLGPSLLGRKVVLFCNYPQLNQEFQRNHYYELQWFQDEGCNHSDDTALYAQLVARIAGSFHYYFTFLNEEYRGEPQGSGFFLVDPILRYGENEILPLDCIQCQTVLAKSLGNFSTWEGKLRVAKESGYNVIHFTPIQELGGSNSSYSLSEQSKLNPIFSKGNNIPVTFQDIEKFIAKLRKEWKVASICDIVLNHTANESTWLQTHPEVTYNCSNCPYLRPAYLLDAAFHQFSHDVVKGVYENKGIPPEVNSEEHLNAIRYALQTEVLPFIKIHELFICDSNKLIAEFLNLARQSTPRTAKPNDVIEELKLIQDQEFKRLGCTINMELALKNYNVYRLDCFDEETRIKRCGEDFKNKLDALNQAVIVKINEHLSAAVENVIAGIRYFRVQLDGPRIQEVSVKNPLTGRYFTDYGKPLTFNEHEEIMYSENGKFLMAHNGWVINADPLKNFAASDSYVYLRRELIAWGDSVKLRYGEKPEDCPFLWNHMRAYVEQTAKIFDGVRLDNCHSTPIAVAEYLLDCARKIRPNLYVVAELFTNSDHKDNIFVNRLGITSLIREAMSAWDSHEEGRLVYRYGGYPVGSFMQPRQRPLVPTVAHALFLDLTHDNPSPIQKRSIFDLLPSSALVNMACCASGSNRGYDELVPHHIHVVDETRQYTEWTDNEELLQNSEAYVGINSGIIAAKKAINNLHFYLGANGFNQVYVDQMDPDVVAVTRHNPKTHESFVLVAFTAFGHPDLHAGTYQRGIRPLRVEGVVSEIVFEATLNHFNTRNGGSKYTRFENFTQDNDYINGVKEYFVEIKEHIKVSDSQMLENIDSGTPNVTQLNFKNFKPGSVLAIRVLQPDNVKDAIIKLRELISTFSQTQPTELRNIIGRLKLEDLNHALYRCDQEERDGGNGFDVYSIPNYGSLVYAGFQGFLSLLANIRPSNDLGHPMCANLRDGNWMIDYIWQRLKVYEGTKELGEWIEENSKPLKEIPRYLIPCYFDVLVTGIYIDLVEQSYKLMSGFVNCGSTFVRGLALGSVQMGGIVKSAKLPTLSPNLVAPKPTINNNEQITITLSAGLPHFATGYMRNWGRDTFIALRGLFILTGRYQEARYHILGYAACLRHGLIPNLLDGGNNPRYNCRDAIWWWLQSIKSYVNEVPNGVAILNDVISRIFPTDDAQNQPPGAIEQPLHEVIQEGLTVHFQGLAFRERNAGRQIDAHMTDRGFNNQIGIHPETGFVFGGNEFNCGTWMDKMGSSDKAGNRGKPATPRDGSAVELIGLSKSVISWLAELSKNNQYPYDGVERTQKNGKKIKWTFQEWAEKIQNNFEKFFWVNTTPVEREVRPDLINKRGIYKDCYGATQAWTDYQLRCNFPIAMVVAPELFDPKHAWTALQQAEKYLLGPLGMKTLDPEDWAYRGDYDNSNDSTDPAVAHGLNYHQGPEWVWPLGFYLRARLIFASANNALEKTVANTKTVLSKHFTELQTSPWRGLPELTNKNGAFCRDSCRTQAWSMSCILEALDDLQKIEARCN